MPFIYVIGAQCTGKTTLVEAITAWIAHHMPQLSFGVLRETARTALQLHQFTRDDVRAGGPRCLQLQKLIMQSQDEREGEVKLQNLDVVIADRSGADPLVYARMYCDAEVVEEMLESNMWRKLRSNMREGVVVVCEPVREWLADDGTRLVPLDWKEWRSTHELFCATLDSHHVTYTVLPASVLSLEERVNFVISLCDFASKTRVGLRERMLCPPYQTKQAAQPPWCVHGENGGKL